MDKNNCGIVCSCGHCHEEEIERKQSTSSFWGEYGLEFIFLIASILLFVGSLIVNNYFFSLIFAIVSALVCGFKTIIGCFKGIIKGKLFNENTLMVIASLVCFILGDTFEGCLIIILFNLGELLEDIAINNSRKKITNLSALKVKSVRLFSSNGVIEVSPDTVLVGSLIEVRKGDMVAIDGILIDQQSYFDMKSITGESQYCQINTGERVYSGAINVGNPVVIKTTKEYKDSTSQKIISLIEGANANKAKSQRFISSFAEIYTPIVVLLAFLMGVIPPIFNGNWTEWINRGLTFLVISCPCALVISVPLSYFIGIGSLSKNGILIKGSKYVDILSKVSAVVFDKTGTITEGALSVEKVECYNGYSKDEVIKLAFSLEQNCSHPIARAIVNYKIQNTFTVSNLKEVVGYGVMGEVDGKKVIVGKSEFMKQNGIDFFIKHIKKTSVYVAVDKICVGQITFTDKVKNNAFLTIKQLQNKNIKNYLLSGDKKEVCEEINDRLQFNKIYYELLPEQKVDKLGQIMDGEKGKVLFVGDGINDAPTLANADVGVSMGAIGSDIAINNSDVVIMDDDISKIPFTIKSSKRIRRKVIENIVISICVKVAVMILSFVFDMPVWLAMVSDVGVMMLAVINSLTNFWLKK